MQDTSEARLKKPCAISPAEGKDSSYCASILLIHSVYSFTKCLLFRMMSAGAGITIEKIDRIYFCTECKMVFLFKSDASDHRSMQGHSSLKEMPFE